MINGIISSIVTAAFSLYSDKSDLSRPSTSFGFAVSLPQAKFPLRLYSPIAVSYTHLLRGSYSDLTDQGVISYWVWGYMACDFVWENEAWKIWHMQELHDIHTPCGTSWANGPGKTDYPREPVFAPMASFKMPAPNLKQPARAYYTVNRPATPSPSVPEPYETFSETFSYGV